MKMFLDAQTRQEDASRQRTTKHFCKNLEQIINSAQEADVEVILSTVAVNLKDCAPFASLHSSRLSASQLLSWEGLYQQGTNLDTAGKWEQALAQYLRARAIDPEFAELQFRLGRCYLAVSNFASARRCFQLARDSDGLSFRADSRINAAIEQAGDLAKKVALLDAVEALARSSAQQIPGNDLFYEHVHLNFEGNYLLARALAEQVAARLPAAVSSPARKGRSQGGGSRVEGRVEEQPGGLAALREVDKDAWPGIEVCHRKLA